jgi:hypothetical protein
MFASSLLLRLALVAVAIVVLWALFANDSGAAGAESRYRVKPGDTLWSIATAHFAGDPREGVWELERRNELHTPTIQVGQILVLP